MLNSLLLDVNERRNREPRMIQERETNHDRINKLIEQTEDPVQRATLIVLANIDHALDASAHAQDRIAKAFDSHRDEFKAHTKEFIEHVANEDRMFAAAKGAQWASVLFLGALQIAAASLIGMYIKENDSQNTQIATNTKRLYDIERRMAVSEAKRGVVEKEAPN